MIDDMKKTKKKKSTWKKPKLKNVMAESDERDGMTQGYIGLPERVIKALSDCGTGQQGLWFTRKAVYEQLGIYEGVKPSEDIATISQVLNLLVKEGYLDRALHPTSAKRVYIFRRTLKPFKVKIMGRNMIGGQDKIQKGYAVFTSNRKLPKWFRDMMH